MLALFLAPENFPEDESEHNDCHAQIPRVKITFIHPA